MRHSKQELPAESEQHELTETPICNRLLELGSRDVVSFHALPLTRLASVRSSPWRGKYEKVFGREVLQHDLTYTGEFFDTPVLPRLCVERSRRTTARAFRSEEHTSELQSLRHLVC